MTKEELAQFEAMRKLVEDQGKTLESLVKAKPAAAAAKNDDGEELDEAKKMEKAKKLMKDAQALMESIGEVNGAAETTVKKPTTVDDGLSKGISELTGGLADLKKLVDKLASSPAELAKVVAPAGATTVTKGVDAAMAGTDVEGDLRKVIDAAKADPTNDKLRLQAFAKMTEAGRGLDLTLLKTAPTGPGGLATSLN